MGKLFTQMLQFFLARYKKGQKTTIINLGGSRSKKTYEAAQLLLYLCDTYKISTEKKENGMYYSILDANGRENLIIDVYRKQLKDVRKTFADFCACINILNAKGFKVSSANSDAPTITAPNGNIISFHKLPDDNKPIEAGKSHIIYFNEALEIPSRKIISNAMMRCELMVIFDSNPSLTTHWLFDMADNDKDALYTHTTYKDNEFLPQSVIDGIESYCPWDLSDYQLIDGKWRWVLPESQRKPNETNILNKTADKRLWMIYGEGLRCAREGAAFPDLQWIDEFPTDIPFDIVIHGMDFGYTNDQTALVRVGVSGRDIYVKLLYYAPTPKSDLLFAEIESILLEEQELWGEVNVACESQDNRNGDYFVWSLAKQKRVLGYDKWHFFKVKKPPYRSKAVDLVNNFNLHVVRTPITEKEFLNFVFEERNGEITSILHGLKGHNNFDHCIDAMLYACWETLKYRVD